MSTAAKRFAVGFAVGAAAFALLNLLPFFQTLGAYNRDGFEIIGFPITFRRLGGIAGVYDFSVIDLLADIALGLVVALLLGYAWCASVNERRRNLIISGGLMGIGLPIAGFQWWQIWYRWDLYYGSYGAQRYSNHVADGTFYLAYIIDAAMVIAGIVSVLMIRRDPILARIIAGMAPVLNFLGAVTLFMMHRLGILVEYGDFIRHM